MRGDRVDLDALERLCRWQIDQGATFLVPCGTTGESPTLTDEERITVIERTVEAAAGRVPVVAGTGTNDTHHSVAMTKAARRVGADACLAVAPYYNRPTQAGMLRLFRAMIDEGGLPAMLYHIPGRSVVSIDVETVARVAAGGGVIGIKETGSVDRVTRLREEAGVRVFCGDDGLTLPMIALGAVGVVSVASNVAPSLVAMLVSRAREDRNREARLLHERLSPLFRALFLEPNPVPVKAALVLSGILESDRVRLPLTEATDPVRDALRDALRHLGAHAAAAL
jgi:4-hydroxy-tetrahydrodipicolinate synthase